MVASWAFLALLHENRELAGPAHRVTAVAFLVLAARIIAADFHFSVVFPVGLAAIALA